MTHFIVSLNERESEALAQLCKELELSESGVMRQALRIYQLVRSQNIQITPDDVVGCPSPE